MNGLVNRSIQHFVSHTYGSETWLAVTQTAGLGFSDFEGMLSYRETYTPTLIEATTRVLDRGRAEIMEDFGNFLVSHPIFEAVRRLLRFGGIDFVDFLHSLDDLGDRVRLALPNLRLPGVELQPDSDQQFSLICDGSLPGYGHVMVGVLRAMADDYGALAVIEHAGTSDGSEVVLIRLVDEDFSEGRHFDLAGRVA